MPDFPRMPCYVIGRESECVVIGLPRNASCLVSHDQETCVVNDITVSPSETPGVKCMKSVCVKITSERFRAGRMLRSHFVLGQLWRHCDSSTSD